MTTAITAPMPVVSAGRLPLPQGEVTLVFGTPYGHIQSKHYEIPIVCEEVFFFSDFASLVNVQRLSQVSATITPEPYLYSSGDVNPGEIRQADYAVTISQLTLKLKNVGDIVTVKDLTNYPVVARWINKSQEAAQQEANDAQIKWNTATKEGNVKRYLEAVQYFVNRTHINNAVAEYGKKSTSWWFTWFTNRDKYIDKYVSLHKNDVVGLEPLHISLVNHGINPIELRDLAQKQKDLDAVIKEVEGLK